MKFRNSESSPSKTAGVEITHRTAHTRPWASRGFQAENPVSYSTGVTSYFSDYRFHITGLVWFSDLLQRYYIHCILQPLICPNAVPMLGMTSKGKPLLDYIAAIEIIMISYPMPNFLIACHIPMFVRWCLIYRLLSHTHKSLQYINAYIPSFFFEVALGQTTQ